MATNNLQCSVGYIIDKSTVVTYQHNCTRTLHQELLQPLYTLDIKVVGRLIKQQHIRLFQQYLRQFNAHAPAS